MQERHYLNVPYKEKDAAKALGARYDPESRRWWVHPATDLSAFAKWAIVPGGSAPAPVTTGPGSAPSATGADRFASRELAAGTESGELSAPAKGISLSRLLGGVATAISQAFRGGVWTMVEVMQVTLRNGHVYLELSERDRAGQVLAKAHAMIWANTAARILPEFERATGATIGAGIKLLVRAKPGFKPQFGFSLEIDAIDFGYTLGDLAARMKEIRGRLQREGVFEQNKNVPPPWNFTSVLVVAPHEAAGLGDFRKESDRLAQFGLCRFTYAHSRFQGEGAAREIVAALTNALDQCAAAGDFPDAVVIIRGGGAVNNLAWLNDYELARFICDQRLPVLTGIGHERDSTIVDEGAHAKFDTPSKVIAAIEKLIARRAREAQAACESITTKAERMTRELSAAIDQAHSQVAADARAHVARARQESRDAMNAIGVAALQDVHQAAKGGLHLVHQVRQAAAEQVTAARQLVPRHLADVQARASTSLAGDSRSTPSWTRQAPARGTRGARRRPTWPPSASAPQPRSIARDRAPKR
ncbi:exodeoxyribonuclease VII large subunit [Variovorax sp. RA8]|uniref:exodeoxyribonuclease VII large subunit n=1 Tax=Variovorax sp. (strain JCM 16519 / RA8) TaxID=662548 RepID=UPI001317D8FF|nr:exodeoxyribonuclease VII large subunit [Variovorax sp. RA8]VTU41920.1 Exodeoxyribonuclease 7 large subunit [Variovorax sp. RA8]